MRNDEFAMAFVKTAEGIRKFAIMEIFDEWVASYEQGRNHTTEQK